MLSAPIVKGKEDKYEVSLVFCYHNDLRKKKQT